MDTLNYKNSTYVWAECLEDFCGSYNSPGFSADLWRNEKGKEIITFCGNWAFHMGEKNKQLPNIINGEIAQKVKHLLQIEDSYNLWPLLKPLLIDCEPVKEKTEVEMVNDIDSFLDFLDSRDCWYNDLNGRRKAHMDSYMTLPDCANIDKALDELKLLKRHQWEKIYSKLIGFSYMSPNSSILAAIIFRKYCV